MPPGTRKSASMACSSLVKIMRPVSNRMGFADVVHSSGIDSQAFWRHEV